MINKGSAQWFYMDLKAKIKFILQIESRLYISESESHSVLSDSLRPPGLYSPWSSPGQNTGVVAIPFSRGSSLPRDWTQVSHIAGGLFTSWATEMGPKLVRWHWLIPRWLLALESWFHLHQGPWPWAEGTTALCHSGLLCKVGSWTRHTTGSLGKCHEMTQVGV